MPTLLMMSTDPMLVVTVALVVVTMVIATISMSLSSRILMQSCKTVVTRLRDVQGSQTVSFSVGMAEAYRQQGVSLSIFSTYPPGQSNPVWPSLLYKLFEHAEQVRHPHQYPANTSVCKISYSHVGV